MDLHRFYIRAGVNRFPVEKQAAMQADAGFGEVPTYVDAQRHSERKKRDAKTLAQRQALLSERTGLLRPTNRDEPEVIGVAGIRCLALNPRDLMSVMAACKARRASVYCLDTRKHYDPAMMAIEEADELQADFESALNKHQTVEGRRTASEKRTEQADRDRAPIIKLVKPLWGMDESDPGYLTISEIVALLVSKGLRGKGSSLNKWLGPRWEARQEAKKKEKPQ